MTNIKLVTNTISLGGSGSSFNEYVQKKLAERRNVNIKTAAKVAETAPCCDNDEKSDEGATPEKGKFPETQKVEGELTDTESSNEKEIKISSESCDQDSLECVEKGKFPDDFKPEQKACDEKEKECCDADTKKASTQKEAGELPEALEKYKFKKKEDKDNKDDDCDEKCEDKDDDCDEKSEDEEKEACEASKKDNCDEKVVNALSKFVRVANLTPKQKEFVASYFKAIYPQSYVDALVQDR